MKKQLTVLALSFACLTAAWAQPYQSDWDSLSKHEDAPEWFKDAKLGITPKTVKAGIVTFAEAGVYHLVLSAQPRNWRAVNVWHLKLLPVQ